MGVWQEQGVNSSGGELVWEWCLEAELEDSLRSPSTQDPLRDRIVTILLIYFSKNCLLHPKGQGLFFSKLKVSEQVLAHQRGCK